MERCTKKRRERQCLIFSRLQVLIHLRPGQRTASSEVSNRRERLREAERGWGGVGGVHYKESGSEWKRADKVKQERGERRLHLRSV